MELCYILFIHAVIYLLDCSDIQPQKIISDSEK